MGQLMQLSRRHPFAVLTVVLAISVAALVQLPGLKIDSSMEGLRAGDPAAKQVYEAAVETFGTDKINIIYIRDPELFSPENLAVIDELGFALSDVPGITRVESLFTVNNFTNEDGMLVTGPLAPWVPETPEEAEQLLADARANPMINGSLVSASGRAIAINLFVETGDHPPHFYRELATGIEAVIAPLKHQFEVVFQIGDPSLRYEISEMMLADQKRIIPFSVIALLVTLAAVSRSLSCAALPMITSCTSILWVAGFMSFFGIPVNILTVLVPSLILVIGSTEDVHLLLEYESGLVETGGRHPAINFMIRKMGVVVMVTAVSTFLGFLSICLNDVIILRQFGMAASFGLFVNPLVTCALTPVYLRFFGSGRPGRQEAGSPRIDRLTDFVSRRKRGIILVTAVLTLAAGLAGLRLNLENDYLAMFRKDAPVLKRLAVMTADFPGTQTFFIHIRGGHKNLFKDPENLSQLADIQAYIRDGSRFDNTVSITDFLALIHGQMSPDDPNSLPDSRRRVTQYLAFMEADDLSRYVSPDFSQANIMVRHDINASGQLKKALADLEQAIRDRLNPHFTVSITGDSILTLQGADAIAAGQVKSIGLLLFIIFVIMSVIFTNVKAGLLSLVPNIIPVAVNFGIMGLLGIPLNVGTAMVAVIAIGIAVDDTLHFMTRYNDEMHRQKDQDSAMRSCIRSEFRVVAATSVALSLGFAVLGFSQFMPIVQFGMLSASVMLTAFLCDIFVTPILLASTRLLTMWDILSLKLRKDVIEQSEFFMDMKMWQIKKVVLLARMVNRKKGDTIYREGENGGDHGQSMYLLLEGNVQRYHRQSDTGKAVAVGFYSPGDIFGYISILNNSPRSANTRALTDVTYVEINGESLDRLKSMYPYIWGKVYRNLARILGDQLVVWQGIFSERSGAS